MSVGVPTNLHVGKRESSSICMTIFSYIRIYINTQGKLSITNYKPKEISAMSWD